MVDERGQLLQFPDAFDVFVPAVAHDGEHAEEVVARTEATSGEVALGRRLAEVKPMVGEGDTLYWTGS